MLRNKCEIVIGLTTFNTEMLWLSVPAIARLHGKFTLIIHNDNPAVRITRRDIRRMGYRGRLMIINSDTTVGLRNARIRIVDVAPRATKWIIFVNDDDILADIGIAACDANNFAIVKNSINITRRISDLMHAAKNPADIRPDGDGIIMRQPNLSLCGTPVRMEFMRGAANMIAAADARISEIDAELDYRPPVDDMMWAAVCEYAHRTVPDARPIFMDCIGYISNKIDTAAEKYGRPALVGAHAADRHAHVMARYAAAVAAK